MKNLLLFIFLLFWIQNQIIATKNVDITKYLSEIELSEVLENDIKTLPSVDAETLYNPPACSEITGNLSEPNGDPVVGMEVQFINDENSNGKIDIDESVIGTATSDADGDYSHTFPSGYTFADDFERSSFIGNNYNSGTLNWKSDWSQSGSSSGISSNTDSDNGFSGGHMFINGTGKVTREFDLSIAESATVSFDYDVDAMVNNGEGFRVLLLSNGFQFFEIYKYTHNNVNDNINPTSIIIDIPEVHLGQPNVKIRIQGLGLESGDDFWFDNLSIEQVININKVIVKPVNSTYSEISPAQSQMADVENNLCANYDFVFSTCNSQGNSETLNLIEATPSSMSTSGNVSVKNSVYFAGTARTVHQTFGDEEIVGSETTVLYNIFSDQVNNNNDATGGSLPAELVLRNYVQSSYQFSEVATFAGDFNLYDLDSQKPSTNENYIDAVALVVELEDGSIVQPNYLLSAGSFLKTEVVSIENSALDAELQLADEFPNGIQVAYINDDDLNLDNDDERGILAFDMNGLSVLKLEVIYFNAAIGVSGDLQHIAIPNIVTVTECNDPFTYAVNDKAKTPQNVLVNDNLITNDTDPDMDDQTVTSILIPDEFGSFTPISVDPNNGSGVQILTGFGTIEVHSNGDYTFMPESTFVGNVPSIIYEITDVTGATDKANLDIKVFEPICIVPSMEDIDTDGDGVPDSFDIDDDNDGISDLHENSCSPTTSDELVWEDQGFANGQTVGNNTLQTGSITVHVRARVEDLDYDGTLQGQYNVAFNSTQLGGQLGNLVLALDNDVRTEKERIVTTLNFETLIANLQFSLLDVDSNKTSGSSWQDGTEVQYSFNGIDFTNVRDNGDISISFNGGVRASDPTNFSYMNGYRGQISASNSGTLANVTLNFGTIQVKAIRVKFFSTRNVEDENPSPQSIGISDLTFNSCAPTDTDGDGIPNHLDLDSDNDGIPDAIEGQVGVSTADMISCRLPVNPNSLNEAGCKTGETLVAVENSPVDTDNDGLPDYLDLDSDGDLCSDAIEANSEADSDIVNTDLIQYTVAINEKPLNGLVVSCSSPDDDQWQDVTSVGCGNYDFGDLSDSYGNTITKNLKGIAGNDAVWAGEAIDFEFQTEGETAIEDGDDEDGISEFPQMIIGNQSFDVDITLNSTNSSKPVYYGLWIDWENNGTFSDNSAAATGFYTGSIITSSPVTESITITSPSNYSGSPENLNYRLRASDEAIQANDFQGLIENGETEDYNVASVLLPVELISFTAEKRDEKVVLNWETATELNNEKFELEYSLDGIRFQRFGEVAGQGTTREATNYVYTHEEINQLGARQIFYRIRQVDFDGTASYSEIEVVVIVTLNDLTVYPVPAEQGEQIIISSTKNLDGYKIYNMIGILQIVGQKSNATKISISTSQLQPGKYIVVFKNGEQVQFIVQ